MINLSSPAGPAAQLADAQPPCAAADLRLQHARQKAPPDRRPACRNRRERVRPQLSMLSTYSGFPSKFNAESKRDFAWTILSSRFPRSPVPRHADRRLGEPRRARFGAPPWPHSETGVAAALRLTFSP